MMQTRGRIARLSAIKRPRIGAQSQQAFQTSSRGHDDEVSSDDEPEMINGLHVNPRIELGIAMKGLRRTVPRAAVQELEAQADPNYYKIEKIIARRKNKREPVYRVRYQHCDARQDEWLPLSKLTPFWQDHVRERFHLKKKTSKRPQEKSNEQNGSSDDDEGSGDTDEDGDSDGGDFDDVVPDEDGLWLVSKILAHRYNRSKRQYDFKLLWKGYNRSDATWEPFEHLNDFARGLAQQRLEAMKSKPPKKKKREKPAVLAPSATQEPINYRDDPDIESIQPAVEDASWRPGMEDGYSYRPVMAPPPSRRAEKVRALFSNCADRKKVPMTLPPWKEQRANKATPHLSKISLLRHLPSAPSDASQSSASRKRKSRVPINAFTSPIDSSPCHRRSPASALRAASASIASLDSSISTARSSSSSSSSKCTSPSPAAIRGILRILARHGATDEEHLSQCDMEGLGAELMSVLKRELNRKEGSRSSRDCDWEEERSRMPPPPPRVPRTRRPALEVPAEITTTKTVQEAVAETLKMPPPLPRAADKRLAVERLNEDDDRSASSAEDEEEASRVVVDKDDAKKHADKTSDDDDDVDDQSSKTSATASSSGPRSVDRAAAADGQAVSEAADQPVTQTQTQLPNVDAPGGAEHIRPSSPRHIAATSRALARQLLGEEEASVPEEASEPESHGNEICITEGPSDVTDI